MDNKILDKSVQANNKFIVVIQVKIWLIIKTKMEIRP